MMIRQAAAESRETGVEAAKFRDFGSPTRRVTSRNPTDILPRRPPSGNQTAAGDNKANRNASC